MGDGRAEGPSATGDGGQAAMSLTTDIDGMHILIFASLKLAVLCVGYLLYLFCCSNGFSVGHQELFQESS